MVRRVRLLNESIERRPKVGAGLQFEPFSSFEQDLIGDLHDDEEIENFDINSELRR